IEDCLSDSENKSEPKAPLFVPSFAQSFEHVKSPRHYVYPSLKTSNSPPRVTAIKAPVVSAAQGNMSYLFESGELNGGYVSFGGNPKGGKNTGKGKINTGKLDFDDVYFVKELKFNLFSVLTNV
nr:ribonuclease H-like domain-containing protein [Tanacetum cinerariifolium]